MCPEYTIPLLVAAVSRCFIVLRSIQFDDQLCSCAIKINNKPINRTLAHNAHGIISKKLVPELSFLWCHILSEFSSKYALLFIFHIPLFSL